MTTTDQPAIQPLDLDAIREHAGDYDDSRTSWQAHNLAGDVPALIAEVERLRVDNATLRDQLTAAVDKLVAAGWDDVAAQMDAGTWNPYPHTNPPANLA